MPDFFKHYADVDPAEAEALRSKRLKGRYLIALCEWGGHGDFDEVVLRAVDGALRREGFGDELDTPYLQAAQKIDQWQGWNNAEEGRGHFFEEFSSAVGSLNPSQSVAELRKKRILEFDAPSLDAFRRIHEQVTSAPFAYETGSLVGSSLRPWRARNSRSVSRVS